MAVRLLAWLIMILKQNPRKRDPVSPFMSPTTRSSFRRIADLPFVDMAKYRPKTGRSITATDTLLILIQPNEPCKAARNTMVDRDLVCIYKPRK